MLIYMVLQVVVKTNQPSWLAMVQRYILLDQNINSYIIGGRLIPYIMKKHLSIDIDEIADLGCRINTKKSEIIGKFSERYLQLNIILVIHIILVFSCYRHLQYDPLDL